MTFFDMYSKDLTKLGLRIRQQRKQLGLTQEDLGI